MAGLGGVWFPSGMEDSVRIDRPAMSGLLAFLERLSSAMTSRQQRVLADDQLDTIEMTTSVPFNPEEGESDLMPHLASIVTGAEEQLILVTPFFNRFAVDTFVDRVVAAAEDGVTVKIITRDTDSGDNSAAVDRIYDAVADADAISNLEVFDYGAEGQRLHAKALVADEELAYVGSANMTSYSLQEAIEIGVIIEGSTATTVAEFFNSLQSAPAIERIH
jgi:phosphatidylserine/phosphatidylglycerophosphate/cardiolipin synthase-like enzyme